MERSSMCGFCHETVSSREYRCPTCGHNPHVARLDCDCEQCQDVAGIWAKSAMWARVKANQKSEER